MFHHAQYRTKTDRYNRTTTLADPLDAVGVTSFTISDGKLLQSLLRVLNAHPLGKGTSGLVYSAYMNDHRELKCAVKLHRTLMEAKPTPYMRLVKFQAAPVQYLIELVPHEDAAFKKAFQAVVEEFQQEIEYSIRLTLGPSAFRLDMLTSHPIAYGTWKQAQAEMNAQAQKEGYHCLHHMLEFDLQTIPCIVSKQCDGDLLHLAQNEALDPQHHTAIWSTLLSHVLAGIRFMHAQNVAHNDIKPQNIFYQKLNKLTPDHAGSSEYPSFQALVADFGMCTDANQPMHVDFGTPEYVCPELLPAFHKKQNGKSTLDRKQQQQQTATSSATTEGGVQPTVPKQNDAYTFAKTGLWLWAKFKNKDAKERALLDEVEALIRSTSTVRVIASADEKAHVLHAALLAICRARSASERYRLFESLTIEP
jgi:serine/threonine protein kinase